MPSYEYVCQHCGHQMDALQKIADDPLTDCEACGQPALKRKISAPSFRLTGQGWYETDFKSDKDKRRNLADSGDKPATGKSESSSGDGAKKTESKSEKKSSGGDGKAAC